MARMGKRVVAQLSLLNRQGTGKARRVVAVQPKKRGRPRKQGLRRTPHLTRPEVKAYRPIHVVLRVEDGVGTLRRREAYRAVRTATVVVGSRGDVTRGDVKKPVFRIVHLSIQRNHIHLLVEADDRVALSRGMQAFQISAAKQLNRAVEGETRRTGRVFSDRYHATPVTSPKQARHVLAYVLNNWRKHGQDRGAKWRVDPYATGWAFDGWRRSGDAGEPGDRPGDSELGWTKPPDDRLLAVWPPRTWLLRVGWRAHGRIAPGEVPGPLATADR